MKQVLLDTNFILICVKQKIDFFEEIQLMGLQILIPAEVINEIKKVKESNQKQHYRIDAKLALKLIEKNSFKKIELNKKNVDFGIINFAKENNKVIIATLDREIKNKVKNKKLIIREKKRLEII